MENFDPRLPEFRNPPVIEKILGVQFAPIEGWTSGHSGWFWKTTLDESWIKAQDAPQVPDQFERFDDVSMWSLPAPKISFNPQSRLMITNNGDDRLIQLQETRFLYNWKKQEGAHLPFTEIYLEFEGELRLFDQFLVRRIGAVATQSMGSHVCESRSARQALECAVGLAGRVSRLGRAFHESGK